MKGTSLRTLLVALLCCLGMALDSRIALALQEPKGDKHYTDVGFFDIHLCNWPGRGVFYLALFSTELFDDIKQIEVLYPDDQKLGDLDLTRYRLFPANGAQREKRVFMSNFAMKPNAPQGWFYAIITRNDGSRYVASDLVMNAPIARASGQDPPPAAESIQLPKELRWTPIEGATRYKVFIKDAFLEQIIFESDLLEAPALKVPDGLLEKGGAYLWQVHARDIDGHVELGDFNAGSLSDFIAFSVAE